MVFWPGILVQGMEFGGSWRPAGQRITEGVKPDGGLPPLPARDIE